jgi:hypothetical protein
MDYFTRNALSYEEEFLKFGAIEVLLKYYHVNLNILGRDGVDSLFLEDIESNKYPGLNDHDVIYLKQHMFNYLWYNPDCEAINTH